MRRFLLIAAGLCVLAGSHAGAEIYRWVDDEGVVHLSDSPQLVEERYRDRLERVDKGKPEDAESAPNVPPEWLERVEELNEAHQQGQPSAANVDWLAVLSELNAWQLMAMLLKTLLGFVFGSLVVSVFYVPILWGACKLANQEFPGFGMGWLIGVVTMNVTGVASIVVTLLGVVTGVTQLAVEVVGLLTTIVVQVSVLRRMLCESLPKAIAVWLLTFVVVVLLAIGMAVFFGVLAVAS